MMHTWENGKPLIPGQILPEINGKKSSLHPILAPLAQIQAVTGK